MRKLLLPALLLLPSLALAEGRAVTVVNRSSETIRRIMIVPSGSAATGENRLRSQVPPNAEARIGYSSGCKVDVRLGFDNGRVEEFLNQDACADARVTTGQGEAAGAATASAVSAGSAGASAGTSRAVSDKPGAKAQPGKNARNAAAATPFAKPETVPPWTGRSITRRFGGME